MDTGVRAPRQPAGGPGGADYRHAAVSSARFGQGREAYWLFYPRDPAEPAPFVIFLHGWSAMQPDTYSAWIEHVVRKGHVVVYPQYQDSLLDNQDQMRAAAGAAIADAWGQARNDGLVDPAQAGVVWIGHSLGAGFSPILAAKSGDLGLPPPAALMIVEPGRTDAQDIGELPVSAKVLLIVGEDDTIAGNRTADAIAAHLSYLPAGNLETITLRSERRAFPPLIADHFAPLAYTATARDALLNGAPEARLGGLRERRREHRRDQHQPDALDYYGFWKLADGLLDFAYRGRNLEYALGDTPQQRFMGVLSNGEPVQPLLIRRRD